MTTIVNFIQGNFIANPQEKQVQKPFWLLDAPILSLNFRPIVQTLVTRCKNEKKPLIHIDLSLASFSSYALKEAQLISDNQISYVKREVNCPYYLVKTSVRERKRADFLPDILKRIIDDIQKPGRLRQDKSTCSNPTYQFGILIEGLQAWSLLNKDQNHFQKDVESFISGLVTSTNKIRQIVVATWSPLLAPEVNFHLERSSTCLTKLISSNNDEWICQSTVRRYNGFSNEEEYTLRILEAGRVKATKKKHIKNEQRSKDQIQMVNSLGFTVEKDQASKQQQKELKQLIFPHLKMRQAEPDKCKVKGCKESCHCKEEDTENLIILDEEQEDDDDLDV